MQQPHAGLAQHRGVHAFAAGKVARALHEVGASRQLVEEQRERGGVVLVVAVHQHHALVALVERPGEAHPQLRSQPARPRLHQKRAHARGAQRRRVGAAVLAAPVRYHHVREVHLAVHLRQLALEAPVLVEHRDAEAETGAPGKELVHVVRRHLPAHLDSRTTLRRSALGTMTELLASSAM